jgi:hypothetical protein
MLVAIARLGQELARLQEPLTLEQQAALLVNARALYAYAAEVGRASTITAFDVTGRRIHGTNSGQLRSAETRLAYALRPIPIPPR